ncbi:Undecaprenyl-phosphate glucose phosphotransferase [Lysobacter dokdonensis DS-58]|uniref:Undecaprenyl-phosphate glucose phosphotransferase n=1 Tax=Lysobacter dokdonensis DS-58 TaxID=1300345 RepID=A0A0A2WJA0_9GAMM|nr:undecaprenyl-phosphate glucose phosphotransferase [Lysobacter dokdonensis]KGQ20246.1 Undecaprenyl-phosphate glucose phosphotransferase [Lysobacter dokdonensis DS-58]
MLFAPMPQELRQTTLTPGKYGALLGWGLRFADLTAIAGAAVVAWWVRFGHFDISLVYQRHVAMAVLLALPVLSLSRMYRSWRGQGLFAELPRMAGAFGLIFGLTILYAVALKLPVNLSRLWWLLWFGLTIASGATMRLIARRAAAAVRELGMDLRTAVMVGGGQDARRIVDALHRQKGAGIRVLGWFDVPGLGGELPDTPRLGDLARLAEFIERQHVNQVWITLPMSAERDIARILDALAHSTADIKFVPDLLGLQLLNHSVEQIAGLPVINLRASPFDGDARLLKAVEDRVLATVIVLMIAPLLAAIAIGVKLSSPGPVLFRQRRHGLDGKVISVWKFRSMRVHHEAHGQVTQATKGDARITKLGAFLRRTSLDELPQFLNVLQGTMSIVGPRPHAVEHNHQYKSQVQLYMQRHRVKPGITGWAQVNGLRGETDTLDKMERRVEADLYYMQNWSLMLDLRIVAMTIVRGFLGRNAY